LNTKSVKGQVAKEPPEVTGLMFKEQDLTARRQKDQDWAKSLCLQVEEKKLRERNAKDYETRTDKVRLLRIPIIHAQNNVQATCIKPQDKNSTVHLRRRTDELSFSQIYASRIPISIELKKHLKKLQKAKKIAHSKPNVKNAAQNNGNIPLILNAEKNRDCGSSKQIIRPFGGHDALSKCFIDCSVLESVQRAVQEQGVSSAAYIPEKQIEKSKMDREPANGNQAKKEIKEILGTNDHHAKIGIKREPANWNQAKKEIKEILGTNDHHAKIGIKPKRSVIANQVNTFTVLEVSSKMRKA
jgi:hypothetical protein